jgi:hypothetical protein
MKTPKYIRGSYNVKDKERNEKQFHFDCSNDFLKKLKEVSELKGLSKSKLIRQLVLELYHKEIREF